MKYLCYYDRDSSEGRNFVLAATNKIDYISTAIKSLGENVEIVSASTVSSKGNFKKRNELLNNGIKLKLFNAYKWGNVFQKIWATIYFNLTIFFYLLLNVKKDEKIMVYHSLGYLSVIKLAKAIKKFKLILEVEEIYGDVENSKEIKEKELTFFKIADSYIFPTELLNNKVNVNNKPYAIIYGTYRVEKQIADKFDDGKIHCVYAGTFDPRKGCKALVEASRFLTDKYHVHIIGFGNKQDTNNLIEQIDFVKKEIKCTLTYDGLKSGEEYIRFIQSCHIGLSPQNSNASFNDTSFPSKVLSYLANGLRVVSVKIKSLETSSINDFLYYYQGDDPQKIAEAIMSVDLDDKYDSRDIVENLNKKFVKELEDLVKNDYIFK